jgi:Eco57I restriction-modification methylase
VIEEMPAQHQKIQQRLKAFDFAGLFTQELMWNHFPTRPLEIPVDGTTYTLTPVAQRGMAVFECVPPTDAQFPKYAVRRKIDTQVSKAAREHIIIFHDHAKTVQVWQWVKRESGKYSACREQLYYTGQSGDALIQKIQSIAFSLDDEPNITETVGRVGAAFDVEKVTKKFYELFKKEHDTFLKFVEGIPDEGLERWYVSVMLNRLMFIYFIQKKGFLAGDQHYLASKLAETKKTGKDRFYRDFLCQLFFQGFARREEQRGPDTNRLLGPVPYLNGGLFLKHQIEERHGKHIVIPDKAFDRIFNFFEEYDWHLDDRPTRSGREINPDVLGYVFEKYINQREMGAYYTKEDITDYISKNTIIPALFDMAQKSCRIAFEGEHAIWRLLQIDSSRYIHVPMLKGLDKELPKFIAEGVSDVKKRGDWNKTAASEYGLPIETWREAIARRTKCEEIRKKLVSGDIRSTGDLIRYNLDIRSFAEEVIATCEGPELLRAFYKAIRSISVLDPACGSGAFLFAALNVLERLYDTCLVRMQAFVDDLDRSGEKHSPEKFGDFRQVLAEMNDRARHPSPRYFILKSIILNNLYGADIMEEATEICKLRLFLKLVAQVDAKDKIEPLPDIDFNIRAGNSLVGYATESELDLALNRIGHAEKKTAIKEKAEACKLALERFRQQQVVGGTASSEEQAEWKADVNERLGKLRHELDDYLAGDYNIKAGDRAQFDRWKEIHQPFHWFVEFYGLMNSKGFDVVIGNPPYLETREVPYGVRRLRTVDTGTIHGMFVERSLALLKANGGISMILPMSIVSTQRMKMVQELLEATRSVWYANFSWRPGKLFDTVNRALTIVVGTTDHDLKTFSTTCQKWTSDTRDLLVLRMVYAQVPRSRGYYWVPKIDCSVEQAVLTKMLNASSTLAYFIERSDQHIYYRTTGGLYWKVFTDFPPAFRLNGKTGHSSRETSFSLHKKEFVKPVVAALSSDLFWWWYTISSTCRDVNPSDLSSFPLPASLLEDKELAILGAKYLKDLEKNSTMLVRQQKQTGKTETQSFKIQKSKDIIDEIDRRLASHYGLSGEELDFITNFEIKFRLGADDEDAD